MKKIYFLSGLPRSGSTVLAALLQQHPGDAHHSYFGFVGYARGYVKSMGRFS
jgi:hypothetical protein